MSTAAALAQDSALPSRQRTTQSKDGSSGETTAISLSLVSPTLSDVAFQLGKQYHLNVVADAYPDDPVLPRLEFQRLGLREALVRIGTLYGRDVKFTSGIIVLRHRFWFSRYTLNDAPSGLHAKWPDQGFVSVQRIDKSQPAPSEAVSPRQSPARLIAVQAKTAPLKRLTDVMTEKVGWDIKAEPSLAERRITAQLRDVTPGQAVEALTLLVNAAQEVVIGQTDEQKRLAADLQAKGNDNRTEREKSSDKLKPELMGLLTPEQKDALGRGQEVPLKIQDMPADLRGRVVDYVNTTMRDVAGGTNLPIASNRLTDFSIVLLPPPSTALGVNGVLTNGGEVHF